MLGCIILKGICICTLYGCCVIAPDNERLMGKEGISPGHIFFLNRAADDEEVHNLHLVNIKDDFAATEWENVLGLISKQKDKGDNHLHFSTINIIKSASASQSHHHRRRREKTTKGI